MTSRNRCRAWPVDGGRLERLLRDLGHPGAGGFAANGTLLTTTIVATKKNDSGCSSQPWPS